MDTKQQLVNALAGLGSTITEAMDVIEGFVPCGHPALTVSSALVALDADDDAALAQQLETVEGFIDHVSENRGVAAYHGIEVELAGPKADLLAAIREVGALMQTAGVKNTQVNEWVYRSLAALDSSDEKAAEQLAESPAIKAVVGGRIVVKEPRNQFTSTDSRAAAFGQSKNRHHLTRCLCCKIGMFEQLAIVSYQIIELCALACGEYQVVLVIAMER